MNTVNKKLPASRKVAFAFGDVFGGGAFNILNFLYPAYAALTLGLGASLAGVIVMISKIWDAVTDPFMGLISDRTTSRMGKRRIYILAGAPLTLISLVLLFFPWEISSTALRFTAALLSYMFFATVETMIMIPYYSLSSEISSDYTERAKANTLRLAFSVASSIICVAVPSLIVNAVGQPMGYVAMSLTFGLLFAATLTVTALWAKEEVISPPVRAKFSFRQFVKPLASKSFRCYMGMQVCSGTTMAVMSGIFFFYVMYVVKSGNTLAAGGVGDGLGTIAAGVMFATQIVALPLYLSIIKAKGKVFAYRTGAVLWIAVALTLLFVPSDLPDDKNWLIFVLAALIGLGVSGAVLAPHTMVGDVNDAYQLQYGARSEGAVSGLLNFLNKTGQALGVGIALNLLELAGGFVNPDPGQYVAAQPLSAQTMLTLFMALTPLVIMTLGIIASLGYKITAEKQRQLAEFNARYAEAADKDDLEEQRKQLLDTL